jgi:fibronectin type 3 domain-containing protein
MRPAPAGTSTETSSPTPASAPQSVSHSVQLRWAAHRAADVLGYNVYRAARSGGPYARLNPALLANPDYLDTTVVGGRTYYYVVTAVSVIAESGASGEVVAVIPSP